MPRRNASAGFVGCPRYRPHDGNQDGQNVNACYHTDVALGQDSSDTFDKAQYESDDEIEENLVMMMKKRREEMIRM